MMMYDEGFLIYVTVQLADEGIQQNCPIFCKDSCETCRYSHPIASSGQGGGNEQNRQ